MDQVAAGMAMDWITIATIVLILITAIGVFYTIFKDKDSKVLDAIENVKDELHGSIDKVNTTIAGVEHKMEKWQEKTDKEIKNLNTRLVVIETINTLQEKGVCLNQQQYTKGDLND